MARWISIAAHPFVTGTVMVASAAFRLESRENAIRIAAAFVILAVLPVAWLSVRQVRRGHWGHIDASNRRERPLLYAVGIGATLLLFAYLLAMHPESYLVHSIPIVVAMLLACAIATRWVKLSLHVLFAAFAATSMVLMHSPVGYVLVPVVPLVAWSRLALARHTRLEVILGGLVGGVTGWLVT